MKHLTRPVVGALAGMALVLIAAAIRFNSRELANPQNWPVRGTWEGSSYGIREAMYLDVSLGLFVLGTGLLLVSANAWMTSSPSSGWLGRRREASASGNQ